MVRFEAPSSYGDPDTCESLQAWDSRAATRWLRAKQQHQPAAASAYQRQMQRQQQQQQQQQQQ
jgi:hypothetical protein